MSILDELKKWTHPYEDEDEEYDDFEEPTRREPAFEDRRAQGGGAPQQGGQYPRHHPAEGGAGEAGAV